MKCPKCESIDCTPLAREKESWECENCGHIWEVGEEKGEKVKKKTGKVICIIEGCNKPAACKEMCNHHYWLDYKERKEKGKVKKPGRQKKETLPEKHREIKVKDELGHVAVIDIKEFKKIKTIKRIIFITTETLEKTENEEGE